MAQYELVTSGNTGVTERARSTLLTQQRAWEELLPVRAAFPRYARFVAAKDAGPVYNHAGEEAASGGRLGRGGAPKYLPGELRMA